MGLQRYNGRTRSVHIAQSHARPHQPGYKPAAAAAAVADYYSLIDAAAATVRAPVNNSFAIITSCKITGDITSVLQTI